MDARKTLTLALLLLPAAPALAAVPMGPVAGEAVSLEEPARTAASHVQRAHYEAFLAAFAPLTLEGADLGDPSRRARCEVRVRINPGSLPPGSFVDGLPVRRAQPLLFNEFQKQVVAGVKACRETIAFDAATLTGLRDRALDLLTALSGATYCRADEDCSVLRADPGGCGGRAPVTLAGSGTTDLVLFVAFRKFLPALFSLLELERGALASCPRPLWEETYLKAACVRNACRPASS